MDVLVIGGSVVGSLIAGVLIDRWLRHDKQKVDLSVVQTQILEREKAHDERHRLEMKLLENRLDAHEKLLEKLSKRYHGMRKMFLRALVSSGVPQEVILRLRDEDDED